MSRRSRYARVQHASARPGRTETPRETARTETAAPRPNGPRPGPAVPDTAPTSGHLADTPRVQLGSSDLGKLSRSNGGPRSLADAAPAQPPAAASSNGHAAPAETAGCTAPQLRRFIKSRTYVPMHELRRRFGINGTEDDVTLVEMDGRRIFVGLPPREGRLLGELLRAGDVGYELSLDPLSPIVVGVYPMRPVPRT